jgi:two-component system, cell cycle sensor histidine kinase and response regulator CckA
MEPIDSLCKRQQKGKVGHGIAKPDKWKSFLGAVAEAYAEAEREMPFQVSAFDTNTSLPRSLSAPPEIAYVPDLVLRLDEKGNVLGSTTGALTFDEPAVVQDSAEQSDDRTRMQHDDLFGNAVHQVLEKRKAVSIEYSFTHENQESHYEARLVPSGQNQVIAVVRNVTELRRSETLIAEESQILEMIAGGASLEEVLTGLARLNESVFPGVLCSVLLMASDGYHLRHGVAPSLPHSFTSAIDGALIGPRTGSCGTAAYFKRRVIVTDIEADPLWTDYRALAAEHGLRACWSMPILSHQGNVLGTFAMYYRHVTAPSEMELRFVETAVHIAGVAIERNHLEERFRESQKMEAFGQMAGGIAHDFNNILSVILGYTHLLLGDENLKDETKENLMQVCAAGERAANLTRQLLTFGRKKDIELNPLDLNEVVRSIAKMLSGIIGSKINLQCSYFPNLPTIEADEGMMEQMMINLALNGRDAMPAGGKLIIATTIVSLDAAYVENNPDARCGDFVCVSVRDSGFGMTPEIKAHIFEPFFTTKNVGKGSGLGLAVVHGIVKQHEGWIEVETEAGTGTTFKIFLPVVREPVGSRRQTPKGRRARGGDETILLVENEPAVREMSKVILQRYGYRVLAVGSGKEALGEWEKHGARIDLLLTDLIMPSPPTGRELAKQLTNRKPALKVIYSTGFATKGSTFRLRDAPLFLQKPYHPEKLALVIRECLDSGRR